MRIGVSTLVRNEFSPEIKTKFVVSAIRECLENFQLQADLGKWYKIRIDYHKTRFSELEDQIYVVLDFDEISEERIVIKTLEQTCLVPTKSTWQKLKNCYRYLTQRTKDD